MAGVGGETYPLPEDPFLAAVALAWNRSRYAAWVFDDEWRIVYLTDDQRVALGRGVELGTAALGHHWLSPESYEGYLRNRSIDVEALRASFVAFGGMVLADTPGGRDELRSLAHPALHDVVDALEPIELDVVQGFLGANSIDGTPRSYPGVVIRHRDTAGRRRGASLLFGSPAGMAVMLAMTGEGDVSHFERMMSVSRPSRRPSAVLMADLEASSQLSRRLSTANYFAMGRRLVRAADRCIVDNAGLVGRHAGDGIAAFFLVEHLGSESAAASACITAARCVAAQLNGVAERSGLASDEINVRFGLHWGSTLHVGNITSAGRAEVTALGDEANEAARIEACATGGRMLASKALIERLTPDDADTLGIDLSRSTYLPLGQLPAATDKARRDAPQLSVWDITTAFDKTP